MRTKHRPLTKRQRAFADENQRLCWWVAKGVAKHYVIRKLGLEVPELAQMGAEGLCRAIKKYDPAKAKFSTYARFWIRQTIFRGVVDYLRIKIPANEWQAMLSSNPEIKRSRYREQAERAFQCLSTFDPTIEEEKGGDDAAENAADNEFAEEIHNQVQRLSGREQIVIRARYGLNGEPPQCLSKVGEQLGVTRERVRQIQNQALARLRQGFHS